MIDRFAITATQKRQSIRGAAVDSRTMSVVGIRIGSGSCPFRTSSSMRVGCFPDGMFWLVCTLVDPDDDARGGNFLLTATDAAGPWSDPVWLRELDRETFLVPLSWEDGWPVFAPGHGRVPWSVEVPFAVQHSPGAMQGESSGAIRSDDPRWTTTRAQPDEIARREGDGWVMPLVAATLADEAAAAFLGVRQQHRDLDVVATLAVDLQDGEEAGIVIRQSERDHVRVSMSRAAAGFRIIATHRQAAMDGTIGELVMAGARSDEVEFRIRARGQDYEVAVGEPGGEPAIVATADGRTLDSVATCGSASTEPAMAPRPTLCCRFAVSNTRRSDPRAAVHADIVTGTTNRLRRGNTHGRSGIRGRRRAPSEPR